MIVFRNCDVDVPFFWESDRQPPARWHGPGEGPAQYTSSTPSASWAEFLRHAGITDPADLAGIRRAMWTIEIPDAEPSAAPTLPYSTLTGDTGSYAACQVEAARLRTAGATRLVAPCAALLPGSPWGWRTDSGLQPAATRAEQTIVLFGLRPQIVGWLASQPGYPEPEILSAVRPL